MTLQNICKSDDLRPKQMSLPNVVMHSWWRRPSFVHVKQSLRVNKDFKGKQGSMASLVSCYYTCQLHISPSTRIHSVTGGFCFMSKRDSWAFLQTLQQHNEMCFCVTSYSGKQIKNQADTRVWVFTFHIYSEALLSQLWFGIIQCKGQTFWRHD